jgi:hypothetical protein
MRNASRTLTIAGLACSLALVAAPAVLGHAYSAPTATSLRYDEDSGRFKGRVESPRRQCEHGRTVKLLKHTGSGKEVVGETRSNTEGRWSIEEPTANGVYSARIVRRERTPVGHVHACQRGASGTVTVDP